jgi:hypothetical protein
MIICDKEKFIFIHIPKNAGTSMSKNLLLKYPSGNILWGTERKGKNIGIDKGHLYNYVIGNYINSNILKGYRTFCIVRNPYNKVYSAWNYLRSRYKYGNVNEFIKNKLNESFIYGLEIIKDDARVHYRPQYTFVYDGSDEKYVNFIIKYEQMNEDIKELNSRFNLNIPEFGVNTDRDYIKFLNNESIEKINKLYKKDFKLFNYKMLSTRTRTG